jgi:hypothetical protein
VRSAGPSGRPPGQPIVARLDARERLAASTGTRALSLGQVAKVADRIAALDAAVTRDSVLLGDHVYPALVGVPAPVGHPGTVAVVAAATRSRGSPSATPRRIPRRVPALAGHERYGWRVGAY